MPEMKPNSARKNIYPKDLSGFVQHFHFHKIIRFFICRHIQIYSFNQFVLVLLCAQAAAYSWRYM